MQYIVTNTGNRNTQSHHHNNNIHVRHKSIVNLIIFSNLINPILPILNHNEIVQYWQLFGKHKLVLFKLLVLSFKFKIYHDECQSCRYKNCFEGKVYNPPFHFTAFERDYRRGTKIRFKSMLHVS